MMKAKGIFIVALLVAGVVLSGCRVGQPVKIVIPELGVMIEEPNIGVTIANFGDHRGSGNVISEVRPEKGFDRISISAVGDVLLRQGDQESVTVWTDDNLMRFIETEVTGSTLHVRFSEDVKKEGIRPSEDIRYEIELKDLRVLEILGFAEVDADQLRVDELNIGVSGMGEIWIGDLEADQLSVSFSGLGRIALSGEVQNQKVSVSGGGMYSAGDLKSDSTNVDVSGLATVTVWATERLDVRISGGGAVSYYGYPRLTNHSSGLRAITSLGDR